MIDEPVHRPAEVPHGWRDVPLRALIQRKKDSGRSDLTPLSVFLDAGVVPRETRDDNHNRLGADLGSYLVVQRGDLVVNKLRTWQGGLGVSAYEGIVSPAYFVCSVDEGQVLPAFLHLALRSSSYLREFTRLSKSMPPSQYDIAWEDFRNVRVFLPPLDDQALIVRGLTERLDEIDQLIEAQVALTTLLDERRNALIASMLTTGSADAWVRLKYLCDQLSVGVVVQPAALYAAEGIPFLRGVNVQPGRIVLDDLKFLDPARESTAMKSRLRAGDLVVVRTGKAGAAAVIPDELDGANCVDLLIVRPGPRLLPKYAEYLINSEVVQRQVAEGSTGALQAHFNVAALKEVRVPYVGVETQAQVVDRLGESLADMDAVREAAAKHIALARARRAEVVNAAVLGYARELEVAA
jgi:type I restriction enzyme S subunit